MLHSPHRPRPPLVPPGEAMTPMPSNEQRYRR
jgi:hypothetical protein